MATLDSILLTRTWYRLSAHPGVTAGKAYIVQNIDTQDLNYCNYATDPTGTEASWFVCQPYEFFNTGKVNDTSNPIWVRAAYDRTGITVGEAP